MLQVVDYSEKAIALIGTQREMAPKLKELGGRWNPRLTCGAGWIFSAKRKAEIQAWAEANQTPASEQKDAAAGYIDDVLTQNYYR